MNLDFSLALKATNRVISLQNSTMMLQTKTFHFLRLLTFVFCFFKQQETCQVIISPGVALRFTLRPLCFPSTQSQHQDL